MTAAVALPSSRRVSAGIVPEPGATSTRPAWWSPEAFVDEVDELVHGVERDVCRQHKVDPDTVVAVARGMAAHADYRTGRNCRPTNERIVELVRVSLSTVQRARRVLKQLGLCFELVAGRSGMTRGERIAAWRRGSSHRKVAAVFALCSRRARGPKMRAAQPGITALCGGAGRAAARPQAVDRDTPPGSPTESRYARLRRTHLRATTEQRGGRSAPAHTEGSHGRKAGRLDPATRRLADAVRRRLWWLSGVSAHRIAPTLHRFAQAGWTPRDVERAAAAGMTAKGWRVVPRELAQPAAYLATLLRDADPADRPGAVDELLAERDRAQRAYERQLVIGTPCEHGQPAGDVPSPLRGHLACPACRTAAVAWPAVRRPGDSTS